MTLLEYDAIGVRLLPMLYYVRYNCQYIHKINMIYDIVLYIRHSHVQQVFRVIEVGNHFPAEQSHTERIGQGLHQSKQQEASVVRWAESHFYAPSTPGARNKVACRIPDGSAVLDWMSCAREEIAINCSCIETLVQKS